MGPDCQSQGRPWRGAQAELKVACKYATQRLDLVQVGPDGRLSVKKGAPRIVCPELPAPDAGCVGLAGIYIAGWTAADNPNYDAAGGLKVAGTYAITPYEIFPIQPAPPVAPVNKEALARSVKKLAAGGELKIAFMGASVTVGAEAPAWWADLWTEKNLGFPSRVVVGLRKRFPQATVTPIAAFQGGTQTKYGLEVMDKTVIPAKADVVLIDFGGNDVSGSDRRETEQPARAVQGGHAGHDSEGQGRRRGGPRHRRRAVEPVAQARCVQTLACVPPGHAGRGERGERRCGGTSGPSSPTRLRAAFRPSPNFTTGSTTPARTDTKSTPI